MSPAAPSQVVVHGSWLSDNGLYAYFIRGHGTPASSDGTDVVAAWVFSASKAQLPGSSRALPGFPFPAMTAYAYPLLAAIPFPVAGAPGKAGAGTLRVSYVVPPDAAGLTLYQQMHVLDLRYWVTQTNGLELGYGR